MTDPKHSLLTHLLLFALLFSKDTIITTLAPGNPVILQVLNTGATPLRNVTLDWTLQSNGIFAKKGKILVPTLPSNKTVSVRPGVRMPNDTSGETFLILRFTAPPSPSRSPLAPSRPPLAEEQVTLKPWSPRLAIQPSGPITLAEENDIVTIRSPSIRISFNRQTGWLLHYEIDHIDLLDDTIGLRSNFQDPHLQLFSNTTMSQLITIRTEYTLPATANLLHLSYVINATGEMLVTQQVEPDTTQAPTTDTTQSPTRAVPIPRFGMTWVLPPGFDSITCYGPLGSGGVGITHDRVTSIHTALRWWSVTDKNGNGLQFIADTTLLNEAATERQINIDHSGGNYQYTYKVKPLGISTRR